MVASVNSNRSIFGIRTWWDKLCPTVNLPHPTQRSPKWTSLKPGICPTRSSSLPRSAACSSVPFSPPCRSSKPSRAMTRNRCPPLSNEQLSSKTPSQGRGSHHRGLDEACGPRLWGHRPRQHCYRHRHFICQRLCQVQKAESHDRCCRPTSQYHSMWR